MKRVFIIFSTIIFLILHLQLYGTPKVQGGIFNIRNQIIIRCKSNENITTGFLSAAIMTVKYPSIYNIQLDSISSNYGILLISTLTNSGFTYKIFGTASGNTLFNWVANSEYELLKFKIVNGTGTGSFELSNDNFVIQNNGQFYIEHSILGEITDLNTPIYNPIVNGVPLEIKRISNSIPEEYKLYSNYPNPFNSQTRIVFDIPSFDDVIINIFDQTGKNVANEEILNILPGKYSVDFDAKYLSSGIYYYALRTKHFYKVNKMVLIK